MPSLDDLTQPPNALAPHYSRFRVAERLLLTGHSHQAWPDVAMEGQALAWLDAAELVDEKWERAFAVAEEVKEGWRGLLGEPSADLALAASTFELIIRWLSALPLATRRRLVTTDGEFHTLRRLTDRLDEAGMEVVRVHWDPVETLAERLADATDDRTAATMVSAVLFGNARIVPHLGELAQRCSAVGAELLVDAYHALGVVPFSVQEMGLSQAFVTGGGYKYTQLGEGNAFLRVPANCRLKPVVTGWFAEFAALSEADRHGVPFGEGASRFAGATYDPASHYRAVAVFRFFREQGLTPEFLRAVSLHQVGVLRERFDALDLDPAVVTRDRTAAPESVAGFLALEAPEAGVLQAGLRDRGVLTDHRGRMLRLGPAPYLDDRQLEEAMAALALLADRRTGGQAD